MITSGHLSIMMTDVVLEMLAAYQRAHTMFGSQLRKKFEWNNWKRGINLGQQLSISLFVIENRLVHFQDRTIRTVGYDPETVWVRISS